jgi:hypothetical protein
MQAQKGVRTVVLLHNIEGLEKKSGLASKALERQGSWTIVISMKMKCWVVCGAY